MQTVEKVCYLVVFSLYTHASLLCRLHHSNSILSKGLLILLPFIASRNLPASVGLLHSTLEICHMWSYQANNTGQKVIVHGLHD